MVCTSVTGAPSGLALARLILRSRLVSRSVTSAVPSGRKPRPHGTARCFAITSTAAWPSPDDELGDADGLGSFGGAPLWSGGGGPNEQPASTPVTRARAAARRPAAFVAMVTGTAYPRGAHGRRAASWSRGYRRYL